MRSRIAFLLAVLITPSLAALLAAFIYGDVSEVRSIYVMGIIAVVVLALGAALAEDRPGPTLLLTSLLYAIGSLGLWLEARDIPSCASRIWAPFVYVDVATCTATPHTSVSISIPQILIAFALYKTYWLLHRGVETGKDAEKPYTLNKPGDDPTSDVEYQPGSR